MYDKILISLKLNSNQLLFVIKIPQIENMFIYHHQTSDFKGILEKAILCIF